MPDLEPEQIVFTAFQVAPAGALYEEEFLSLISSVESLSRHAIAISVSKIAKLNRVPIRPVVGFQEFPNEGVGGAVEISSGLYRAVVIGKESFIIKCGLSVPETLEVAKRRWEEENALVALAGWDSWVRGILRFKKEKRF